MDFVRAVHVEVFSPGSGKQRAVARIRTVDGMCSEMREFGSGDGDATELAWRWIEDRCESERYRVFALMPMRFDAEARLVVDADAWVNEEIIWTVP